MSEMMDLHEEKMFVLMGETLWLSGFTEETVRETAAALPSEVIYFFARPVDVFGEHL